MARGVHPGQNPFRFRRRTMQIATAGRHASCGFSMCVAQDPCGGRGTIRDVVSLGCGVASCTGVSVRRPARPIVGGAGVDVCLAQAEVESQALPPKLLFVCSPGNPTSRIIPVETIKVGRALSAPPAFRHLRHLWMFALLLRLNDSGVR